MGIDLGDVRIGVAVADSLGMLAHPARDHPGRSERRKSRRRTVAEIAAAEKIGVIVVGLPRNMNGTEGPASAKARAFADRLRAATGCEVRLQDERLTTVAAQKAMHASGRNVKNSRSVIDQAAAQMILQTYLDAVALRDAAPLPEDPV